MTSTASRVQLALADALHEGAFDEDPPLAILYDLDHYRERLHAARAAFPEGTLHALAVKANPIGPLLREAKEMGFAAECASSVEVALALGLGFSRDKVVFDSPAKTRREIARALDGGLFLNVDNLQELRRCAEHLAAHRSHAIVGLRVNPGVGPGTIVASSTATSTSKFGVPLEENRDAILDAFRAFPWLCALHVHVGSQGCSMELAAEGARRVAELASLIEAKAGRCIDFLDIGGGLPVSYDSDAGGPTFEAYARALSGAAPALFEGRYRLVTEFGRAISAKAGWVASRVEYTKVAGGRNIAVIHAGADLFVRTALVPDTWSHRVSVFDALGYPKDGAVSPWDIAGPLCFSGDLVARERLLPEIEPGDFIVVHDAGAYTLSMWSRYNSRRAPAVYGYEGEEARVRLLKSAETEEDVLRFWG